MIVLIWFLFVVISLLLATSEAFLPAPVSVHGISNIDYINAGRRIEGVEIIDKTHENYDRPDKSETNEDEDIANDERDAVDDNERTAYEFEYESASNEKGRNKDRVNDDDNQRPWDPWSILWYIGSFGGLVTFFLIVSCSEWCCRRSSRPLTMPYSQRGDMMNGPAVVAETPPPPYHLFAPPPYDSINYADIIDKTSGEKLNIYVITVQAPA